MDLKCETPLQCVTLLAMHCTRPDCSCNNPINPYLPVHRGLSREYITQNHRAHTQVASFLFAERSSSRCRGVPAYLRWNLRDFLSGTTMKRLRIIFAKAPTLWVARYFLQSAFYVSLYSLSACSAPRPTENVHFGGGKGGFGAMQLLNRD